jgi:hypothetical protein
MVAAEWGSGQVFWSMLWFFLFFLWIWLAITVFADIFQSDDLSGWAKAFWCIFVIIVPFLGIFVYLIARGKKMSEHAAERARAQDDMMRGYVRDVVATAPPSSSVDQLTQLASLREQGVIDESEFQRMKAKVTAA